MSFSEGWKATIGGSDSAGGAGTCCLKLAVRGFSSLALGRGKVAILPLNFLRLRILDLHRISHSHPGISIGMAWATICNFLNMKRIPVQVQA